MRKLLFALLLVIAVSTTAVVSSSPSCRDSLASTYDCVVEWWKGKPDPTPPAPLDELDEAEKMLQSDRVSLDAQRQMFRFELKNVVGKSLSNHRLMQSTELNAVRYRNALVKASMNGDEEIVIDRMVFSRDELTAQIRGLISDHALLQKHCESFAELIHDGMEHEQELIATISEIEHALDRIPLQRVLLLSNDTTASATQLIADIRDIHKKTGSVLRAGKLLTAPEVEAMRLQAQATPDKRDDQRLDAFLSGEDIFTDAE